VSASAIATSTADVSPRTTLAIILGASDFPKTTLSHPQSFANSARDFRDYLTREDGLGLPVENILDLFDTDFSPDRIQEEIADWLRRRREALEQKQAKPRDIVFYYVGHGSFSNPDQQYILAIRGTRKNFEGVSSVKIIDLGSTLSEAANDLRRYLILDCCFAAAAVKALMAPVNDLVQRKTLEAFPPNGTTLLCASDAHDAASAPPDLTHTVFSGSMLSILSQGDRTLESGLSVNLLGTLIRNRIREQYQSFSGLPEVHTPVQTEGNIAAIPLFPNAANRPRTVSERIGHLEERMGKIENDIKNWAKTSATAVDIAALRKEVEKLAITTSSAKESLEQSHNGQSTDIDNQDLFSPMPAELRMELERFRASRENGRIAFCLASALFIMLFVGRLFHLSVIGFVYQNNPVFWCTVVLFTLLSTTYIPLSRRRAALPFPPDFLQKWFTLTAVADASAANVRRTMLGPEIEDRMLFFTVLLNLLTLVIGLTLEFK
jgi:hypothetical protein